MELPCACCGQAMHHRDAGGIRLHGCGGCGGLWLDNRGAQRLTQGALGRDVTALVRRLEAFSREHGAELGGSYRGAARPADAPRRCPACGSELSKVVADPGVELDICAAHGTWFDAGEFEVLDQQARIRAASEEAEVAELSDELDRKRRSQLAPPRAWLISELLDPFGGRGGGGQDP